MKKILLTGGNGFIGKNILESFLAEKYDIVAPRSFNLNLIDTDCVDNYFKNKEFDAVLHAGIKAGHRNAKDPTNLFYSNLRMFQNLERHKDKFGKLINFGSGAGYDLSVNISNDCETDIFKNMPKDDHGFFQYIMNKQILQLKNFVNMNIFGIFGKYEDWEIRFISNAVCKTIFDIPITLRQNRRFSYLYVDDLMPILEFFIENDTKYNSYNIVPDEKTELLELAKIIKAASDKDIEIKVAKEGYGLDYTGDNSRLKNEFDAKFLPLKDSVEKLYLYYDKNKNMLDKKLLLADK